MLKKLLLFLIMNNSKSLKTDLGQIYTVDSWIVFNFVGCGLDAQLVLGFMIISENGCQFLVQIRSYVEISVMRAGQWECVWSVSDNDR